MQLEISYKNIWKIALPIILSGVAQNIVNVTDTAFLGRVGIVELGAAGNSIILYFVSLMLGMGFTISCQIIIGRRNGEQNYKQIGSLLPTALYFLLPLSFVIFLILQFLSPWLLSFIVESKDIYNATITYIKMRSFGVFFAFVNFLFIAFYTGITKTKVLTVSTFIQASVNVVLDYLLIFGNFGFPEMGIKGAAIASFVSEVVASIYFVTYTLKYVDIEKYALFQHWKYKHDTFKKIIKIGFPIMIQNFIAITTWLFFFLIIEKVGETELAVSHIIRSLYMVLMIPLFGFSNATSTLVSNLIGQGGAKDVPNLVKKVITLCFGTTLLLLPLNFLIPEQVLSIYTNDAFLIEKGVNLLYIVSATMLLFSVAYIAFMAVTGTGKTNFSLGIESISVVVYLGFAYWTALVVNQPLELVWCSEFIYFIVMGACSIIYLKYGNWKSAEV